MAIVTVILVLTTVLNGIAFYLGRQRLRRVRRVVREWPPENVETSSE